jgi:hypothetical protein
VLGEYTDDVLSGVWKHWRENGRLSQHANYSEAANSLEMATEQPPDDSGVDVSQKPNDDSKVQ